MSQIFPKNEGTRTFTPYTVYGRRVRTFGCICRDADGRLNAASRFGLATTIRIREGLHHEDRAMDKVDDPETFALSNQDGRPSLHQERAGLLAETKLYLKNLRAMGDETPSSPDASAASRTNNFASCALAITIPIRELQSLCFTPASVISRINKIPRINRHRNSSIAPTTSPASRTVTATTSLL
ncbi:hypothetical protein BO70DRAFT_392459 [Aspergillus heteromorphus CBS 117.55]|uniref:Uncharacterized protein n=1 Tax=Aspergillus heteromorphus CBS 117.55 TaxID=1448321 RepID=A0A317WWL9_9EURO|nr:uncharacterized protein BO70DRAFT_392459 [Aspergillus heteromorphus CBS 117.55]PWY90784.1 hypothetical protein BO70DRAFT_392459 [Aspergillus heteromorphus CBS 117.55]